MFGIYPVDKDTRYWTNKYLIYIGSSKEMGLLIIIIIKKPIINGIFSKKYSFYHCLLFNQLFIFFYLTSFISIFLLKSNYYIMWMSQMTKQLFQLIFISINHVYLLV